ncbi:MAG: hypothetical protein V1822_02320 [Candidatus Micrarchaeota archaeon]
MAAVETMKTARVYNGLEWRRGLLAKAGELQWKIFWMRPNADLHAQRPGQNSHARRLGEIRNDILGVIARLYHSPELSIDAEKKNLTDFEDEIGKIKADIEKGTFFLRGIN